MSKKPKAKVNALLAFFAIVAIVLAVVSYFGKMESEQPVRQGQEIR